MINIVVLVLVCFLLFVSIDMNPWVTDRNSYYPLANMPRRVVVIFLLQREFKMNKKLFKSCILLISFSILLVLTVIKIDLVFSFIAKVLIILSPLFIGMSLAFILNRPFEFFKKIYGSIVRKNKKISEILSLISVYLILIGAIVGIVSFLVPQLSESINMFYDNLGVYSEQLNSLSIRIFDYLDLNGFDISGINAFLSEFPTFISDIITGVLPHLLDFTTSAVTSVLNIVLGLIFSIYILADKDRLKRQFLKVLTVYFPSKKSEKIKYVLNLSNRIFSRFVTGQLMEALILGVLCFIGMLIFGFNYPLLISVIIAATSLIPVAGPIIGAIPAIFILLLANPIQALWFVVFIIILQQIEGNVIYPRVVGDSIGLPALWVLLAIIVGGGLFGILGMLLGVPTASVLYHLIKENANRKLAESGEHNSNGQDGKI